jgi:predicted nucleotidyltransferase
MVASIILPLESLSMRVAEVVTPRPVMLAYLFGSAATGQMTPLSDVDIALVVDEDQAFKHSRLQFELEIEDELAARCELNQIDVRVINAAPLLLRGEVVTHGLLLFARNEETRIEFETRTRMEYFDFLPAAVFYREAFFENLRQRGLSGQRSKIAESTR